MLFDHRWWRCVQAGAGRQRRLEQIHCFHDARNQHFSAADGLVRLLPYCVSRWVPQPLAAITAGGIAAPLIATTGVSPELMVIAVGSGSVIFSHVNDPGFWLFKEYFNLTIGETIKSWSMLETIISVCGLVGCLLLNMVI